MVSVQAASRAGKKYESDLMKHLREQGLDVERLRLSGVEDEGDLLVRLPVGLADNRTMRLVIEAKRRGSMDLGGWVREAEVERDNYTKHRGLPDLPASARPGFVVVHYRRQHGVGKSYVTTTLEEYLRQIGAV